MADSFDVVVVGSGSGGAVVARRLVDAGASVCVIEAGGVDENPAIHDPGSALGALGGPDDWAYTTVPQPGATAAGWTSRGARCSAARAA